MVPSARGRACLRAGDRRWTNRDTAVWNAKGGNRTRIPLREGDFKSPASTISPPSREPKYSRPFGAAGASGGNAFSRFGASRENRRPIPPFNEQPAHRAAV